MMTREKWNDFIEDTLIEQYARKNEPIKVRDFFFLRKSVPLTEHNNNEVKDYIHDCLKEMKNSRHNRIRLEGVGRKDEFYLIVFNDDATEVTIKTDKKHRKLSNTTLRFNRNNRVDILFDVELINSEHDNISTYKIDIDSMAIEAIESLFDIKEGISK